MNNKNLSVSSLPDKHLSADVLFDYLEDQLPPADRHEVEMHLLECDLCADALAGLSITNRDKTRHQLFEINYHLKSRIQPRHPNHMLQHLKNWGITTAILFMIILAALLVWYQVKQANSATPLKPAVLETGYTPARPVAGPEAYHKYLRQKMRYPAQARQLGISGTIVATFTVNPDSSLSSLKIVKGIRPDLNQEALRLIKEGPAWVPARQQQKVIRSRQTISIPFELSE